MTENRGFFSVNSIYNLFVNFKLINTANIAIQREGVLYVCNNLPKITKFTYGIFSLKYISY